MGKRTANGRLIAIIAITAVLFAVLAGRFAQFQIFETDAITTQAKLSEEKTISVEAARGEITDRYGRVIAGNSMSYSVIIRRGSFPSGSDREKRIDILDYSYKPIVSAYVDRFQGGTPSHLYAINLMLPVKTWPHPNACNVKVNQPGYSWPIQLSCDISLLEDFYRARLLIDRAVLDDPKDHLLVYVNTAEDSALKQRFNELHRNNDL